MINAEPEVIGPIVNVTLPTEPYNPCVIPSFSLGTNFPINALAATKFNGIDE